MKVLIVVDVQKDFCSGGSLAVPEGEQIVEPVNRLMRSGSYDLVIATRDWHPATHRSFAANNEGAALFSQIDLNGAPQTMWPVHCVEGSPGAEFYPGIETERFSTVIDKGTSVDVDSYSGFFDNRRDRGTGLNALLQRAAAAAGEAPAAVEIDVCGLALDYCVAATARDAVFLGYRTAVVLDACRAVNLQPGDDLRTLKELQAEGVEIVESRARLPVREPVRERVNGLQP